MECKSNKKKLITFLSKEFIELWRKISWNSYNNNKYCASMTIASAISPLRFFFYKIVIKRSDVNGNFYINFYFVNLCDAGERKIFYSKQSFIHPHDYLLYS